MNVLAVGAHPDDIELGCGGTLLAHAACGDTVVMLVMTVGGRGPQGDLSRADEQREAARRLGVDQLIWGGFYDCEVPEDHAAVSVIEKVIRKFDVDVIYTHSLNDTHQDHRATATATLAAARFVSRVISFESPSSRDFRPAMFVDVEEHLAGKLHALRAHESQIRRCRLVDLEAIEAQARFRGFQSRTRLAEAFEVERFVWEIGSSLPRDLPRVASNGHIDGNGDGAGHLLSLGLLDDPSVGLHNGGGRLEIAASGTP
jgi:LmbE family N-acetylglucosaminyl deacetylase